VEKAGRNDEQIKSGNSKLFRFAGIDDRYTKRVTPIQLTENNKHKVLTLLIAIVWLANGLLCKVLHLVPRHEQIVARILGEEYSKPLTVFFGFLEIGMAIWILTKYRAKWCALVQIVIVGTMNGLEFSLVPDLLLWGHLNLFFALLFIALVYYNEFVLSKKLNQRQFI